MAVYLFIYLSVGDFSGSIFGALRNDYREPWLFPLELQLNQFFPASKQLINIYH